LGKLVADGLIVKEDGPYGTKLYRLTEVGAKTRDILFDLSLFGGLFPPDGEIVEPGNRRLFAVTFSTAVQRVVTDDLEFNAALIIDGEPFALTVGGGNSELLYQPAEKPDVIFETTYNAMMALGDGEMDQSEFMQNHSRIEVKTPGKDAEFATLMSDVVALLSR